MANNLIKLGYSNKAHGIKGAFLFVLEAGNDSILDDGFTIYLEKNGDYIKHQIKNIQYGNKVICYLEGIEDRNQVEGLIPFDIYASREDFPEDDGEIYLSDLIGFDVYDEKGEHFGVVKNFSSNGPQDIISIKTPREYIELPFVDQFFPEIDVENKKIIINAPEFIE